MFLVFKGQTNHNHQGDKREAKALLIEQAKSYPHISFGQVLYFYWSLWVTFNNFHQNCGNMLLIPLEGSIKFYCSLRSSKDFMFVYNLFCDGKNVTGKHF